MVSGQDLTNWERTVCEALSRARKLHYIARATRSKENLPNKSFRIEVVDNDFGAAVDQASSELVASYEDYAWDQWRGFPEVTVECLNETPFIIVTADIYDG